MRMISDSGKIPHEYRRLFVNEVLLEQLLVDFGSVRGDIIADHYEHMSASPDKRFETADPKCFALQRHTLPVDRLAQRLGAAPFFDT